MKVKVYNAIKEGGFVFRIYQSFKVRVLSALVNLLIYINLCFLFGKSERFR